MNSRRNRILSTAMAATFALASLGTRPSSTVTVPVRFTVLATTTLTLNEVHDYDSGQTGNMGADGGTVGSVDFGSLTPATYTIGTTGSTHTLAWTIDTNEGAWNLEQQIGGNFISGANSIAASQLTVANNDSATFNAFTVGTFANSGISGGDGNFQNDQDLKLQILYSDTIAANYVATLSYRVN